MTSTALSESLQGRRALVTRGTKRAAAAAARRLARAGADVLVTARSHHPDEAETFIAAGLSTGQGAGHAVAEVHTRPGGAGIPVHALGGTGTPVGGFAAPGEEYGPRHSAPARRPQYVPDRGPLPGTTTADKGATVHATSIHHRMPLRNGTPAHAAAKATPATHGKGPADETAPHCVRVNTVSPGLTRTTTADHPAGRTSQETDNTRQAAPNRLTDPPAGIPLNRPRRPADVTEPVAFPVPDHASAVTDAGHVIDSGTTPTR